MLRANVRTLGCFLTPLNTRANVQTFPSLGAALVASRTSRMILNRYLSSASVRDAPEGLKTWQVWGLTLFGYFRPASLRIRQAQAIYRSCMQQADSPALRRGLGLPMEGFAPQHQLLLIHLWLINKRLLSEGKPGKKLQSELFDTLWENTERRIRRAGIQELSVNKNVAEVQKITFGAMVSYDIGLKKTDDNEQELGSAVWRNLFTSRSDVPDETVLSVCRWMRSELKRIHQLPLKQVEEGDLDWTLPEGIVVTDEDRKYMQEQGMEGEWRSALAVNGQTYWWNTRTRESRWDKPENL